MTLLNGFRSWRNSRFSAGLAGQKGFALIVVLALLFLITAVALVAFSTSNNDRQISSNNLRSSQAYYAAEAGVSRALSMFNDSLWRAGFNDDSIGRAHYSVHVTDSLTNPALKDSLMLRSTGHADGSESQIEVLMARKRNPIFRWGAFGDDTVKMGDEAMLDSYDSDSGTYAAQAVNGPDDEGNMYAGWVEVGSNGEINLKDKTQIHGNVGTPDTIIQQGNDVDIYGTASSSAPTVTLEPITDGEINLARLNSDAQTGLTLSGVASYDPATKSLSAAGGGSQIVISSGLYYFSNVNLSSNSQLVLPPGAKVVIYVTGNLDASDGSLVNNSQKPENLQIYSTGNTVDIRGSSVFYGAVYAPNAEIRVANGGAVYGSLIGRELNNEQGGKIHFDRSLLKLESPLKSKYKAVAWQAL